MLTRKVARPPRPDIPLNLYAIDLGTATYSASHYLLNPGETFDKNNISRIVLASNGSHDYVGPTIAAWHKSGHKSDWIVGRELQSNMQEVPIHKIIKNFKLLLYDAHQESPQTREVKAQLRKARKNAHQLFTAFLDYVWKDITDYVDKELLTGQMHREQCENLVYISVPMLATPTATRQLKAAAREARLPRVQFLFEPLCAGACVLEEVIRMPAYFGHVSDVEYSA
jgi:molecular chaperone DnaK (HSP70)